MSDSKPTPAGQSEATIGSLVANISSDLSELVRSEIQLAKSELKISVNASGATIVLGALAAFLGLLLIILLSITLAFFITMTGLHAAWAFLIVSALYILAIAALGFAAWRKSRKIRSPEKTIATLEKVRATFKAKKSPAKAAPAKPAPAPVRPPQPAASAVRNSRAADSLRDRSAEAEPSTR